MMEKMKWLVVLAVVVIVGLAGCGTYRLDSPTMSNAGGPDAIPIYVEPYTVHDTTAPLAAGTEWDRAAYIKQAIAARMQARFVNDAAKARVTIKTVAFELGHVGWVHCSSTTLFNGMAVKTFIKRPNQFFAGADTYFDFARSDAEMVTIMLMKLMSNEVVHEATGLVSIGDEQTYRGMKDIVIK